MEESRYTIMLPAYTTIKCSHKGRDIAYIHYIQDVKVRFKATDISGQQIQISVYLADSCLDLVSIYCDTFDIYDMSDKYYTVKDFLIDED